MNRATALLAVFLLLPVLVWSQAEQKEFDVVIKDGTVYDGTD